LNTISFGGSQLNLLKAVLPFAFLHSEMIEVGFHRILGARRAFYAPYSMSHKKKCISLGIPAALQDYNTI
jgi:hypothetical protein